MDQVTMNSIKETFNEDFLQFCLKHQIYLSKDKSGAFIVRSKDDLRKCLEYINISKAKLKKWLKIKQKVWRLDLKRDHHVQSSHELYESKTKTKQASDRTRKHISNPFLISLPLTITLNNSYPGLSTGFSIKCVLNTARNETEICKLIMHTVMRGAIVPDYKACIPLLSPIMKQFQKQHKRFHYSSVLKHIVSKEKINLKKKCEYEINVKQVKSFIDLVIAKVVPLKIFGKLKNLKKIKDAAFDLLYTHHHTSINLMLYISTSDIFSIIWLKNIKCTRVMWQVYATFVKWFFTEFLMKVLYGYFHIASTTISNNKRIYILRWNWLKVQKKFIRGMKHTYKLQPAIMTKYSKPLLGKFKLYPKNSSVRPIFAKHSDTTDEKHLYLLHMFLRQLHCTYYGTTNFEVKWKSIVQYKCAVKDKKLYFVCCDVKDAYGSVIQRQLYDIIRSLSATLPEDLVLRYYILEGKARSFDRLCHKQYICDSYLQLPFAPGKLYVRTNRLQCVRKKWLLKRIWKYIAYQMVEVYGKKYFIGKGIPQGAVLSPVLSDIYFDFIIHKEMTTFLNIGRIIRYVDDILFVTEFEVFAKQFLELITKGLQQYNCHFKKAKIQTNVVLNGNKVVDHITYIGYKINCNILEVEFNTQTTALRYSVTSTSKKHTSSLMLLKSKLKNMTSFKPLRIILDNKINSERTIKAAVAYTCLLQVKRAQILIKQLFVDVKKYAKDIFRIILSTNKSLARYILITFMKHKSNVTKKFFFKWNKTILCLLWSSYKNMFIEDKVLRQYFIPFYKK